MLCLRVCGFKSRLAHVTDEHPRRAGRAAVPRRAGRRVVATRGARPVCRGAGRAGPGHRPRAVGRHPFAALSRAPRVPAPRGPAAAARGLRPGLPLRRRGGARADGGPHAQEPWDFRSATDGAVPFTGAGRVALDGLGRSTSGGSTPTAAGSSSRSATARPAPRPMAPVATCSTRSRAPTSAETTTAGGWSTSTSPTTRPASTTTAGSARSPPRGQPDRGQHPGGRAAPRGLLRPAWTPPAYSRWGEPPAA